MTSGSVYVSNESSVVAKKDVTNRAIKKDVTNREIYFFSTNSLPLLAPPIHASSSLSQALSQSVTSSLLIIR